GTVARRRHVAKQALDVERARAMLARRAPDEAGVAGVEHANVRLELLEKDGLLLADDLRHPDAAPRLRAGGGVVDTDDAPDGVSQLYVGSGGDRCWHLGSCATRGGFFTTRGRLGGLHILDEPRMVR